MVVQLEIVDQTQQQPPNKRLKFVTKMAMFNPNNIVPSMTSLQYGGSIKPLLPQNPTMPQHQPLMGSYTAQPLRHQLNHLTGEERIMTGLSHDIVNILSDQKMSDSEKAAQYLHAINRYLTMRGRVFQQIPVASVQASDFQHQPTAPAADPNLPHYGQSEQIRFIPFAERMRMGRAWDLAQQKKQNQGRREASAVAAAAAAPQERALDARERAVPADENDVFNISATFDEPVFETTELRQIDSLDILSNIASTRRNPARRILNAVELRIPDEEIGWDARGRLILDGEAIAASNMSRILTNMLNKTPNNNVPGYEQFVNKLIKYNIDLGGLILSPAKLAKQQEVRSRLRSRKQQGQGDRIYSWNKI